MASAEGHGTSRKRSRDHFKGEALQLVLEPPSVPGKKRKLGKHKTLKISFIFHTMARKLGLIRGSEPTTKEQIDLWIGSRELDVIKLKDVTISLGSGIDVLTPVTVFPAWLEDMYDADEVVLDAHQLRRGHMVQEFRPGGSDLFVRRPQQLLRRVRKSERSVEPDVLHVRLKGGKAWAKPMTVLLDSGAQDFHVSDRRRNLLLQSRKGRSLPRRVQLDLGDGCQLHAAPLERVASNDHDFVMGVSLLCQYGAVLDHARHTLAFKVGCKRRHVSTQLRLFH